MKGAIGLFAIALGTAAIAFPMTCKYISASASPVPGHQAANGLECHVELYVNEFASYDGKSTASTTNYVVQIEFLPDNKFRAVDPTHSAINDVMANDYIGKLVTTDTTYSFQDLKNSSPSDVPSSISFTINRATARLEGEYVGNPLYIYHSGWCTSAYVPPRPVPNKL